MQTSKKPDHKGKLLNWQIKVFTNAKEGEGKKKKSKNSSDHWLSSSRRAMENKNAGIHFDKEHF